MGSLHRNNQSKLEFLKGPFIVLHFSYYTLITFLMMLFVILLPMPMISISTKNLVIKHLVWQQLELASELESDLRDTADWGRNWLIDFNAKKTQLISFNLSKNSGAIAVKTNGSVLEEKSSCKMLGLNFSSELDWGSYIISIA